MSVCSSSRQAPSSSSYPSPRSAMPCAARVPFAATGVSVGSPLGPSGEASSLLHAAAFPQLPSAEAEEERLLSELTGPDFFRFSMEIVNADAAAISAFSPCSSSSSSSSSSCSPFSSSASSSNAAVSSSSPVASLPGGFAFFSNAHGNRHQYHHQSASPFDAVSAQVHAAVKTEPHVDYTCHMQLQHLHHLQQDPQMHLQQQQHHQHHHQQQQQPKLEDLHLAASTLHLLPSPPSSPPTSPHLQQQQQLYGGAASQSEQGCPWGVSLYAGLCCGLPDAEMQQQLLPPFACTQSPPDTPTATGAHDLSGFTRRSVASPSSPSSSSSSSSSSPCPLVSQGAVHSFSFPPCGVGAPAFGTGMVATTELTGQLSPHHHHHHQQHQQHQQQHHQQQQHQQGSGEGMCAVCGDNAACQHYGVRTCEGCKGFFKRTVQKGARYVCLASRSCPIDKRRRNRCQFCRFQKCLGVGMVKEVVRTDSLKGRRGRLPSKPKSPQDGSPSAGPAGGAGAGLLAGGGGAGLLAGDGGAGLLAGILAAHKELMPDLGKLDYSRCESTEQQQQQGPASPCVSDAESVSLFYSLLAASACALAAWADRTPGLRGLGPHDRALLLESALLELFVLHLAFSSDPGRGRLVFCTGQALHVSTCAPAFGQWLQPVMEFARGLRALQPHADSLAFLATLVLLSDRHGLQDPLRVEELRTRVLAAMQQHHHQQQQHHHQQQQHLSALLSQLRDLRPLCTQGLQRIFYLKLEDLVPPPPIIDKLMDTLPF